MFKKRKKKLEEAHLQMTSMLDMFTLILAFLLQAIAVNPVNITLSDKLNIPASNSKIIPKETLLDVTISRTGISLKGVPIVKFEQDKLEIPPTAFDNDGNVAELYKYLKSELEKYKFIEDKKKELAGQPVPKPTDQATPGVEEQLPDRELLIIADRGLDFTIIQDVLYTAGALGLSRFRFAVIEKS